MTSTSSPTIPLIPEAEQSWQDQLSNAVRDVGTLLEYLELPAGLLEQAEYGHNQFRLTAPWSFIQRMEKGNPRDPLLLQVLPLAQEAFAAPGYSEDPLAENEANPAPGLIHKYHGRALLIVSPNCAINCRYCFRRHFPYHDNQPSRSQWQQALEYLRADTSINEVILSGGDPLAAPDRQLQWLVGQIAEIQHIQRLRIHSRLPIVIPDRITDAFASWLGSLPLQTVMVIHANHPNEINSDVAAAMSRLKAQGVCLLNQSVLLKHINNCPDILARLSEKLFDAGVLPYYLHLLDTVQGAAHFEVSEEEALCLLAKLQHRLPGFLVPRLAREVAGAKSKWTLTPENQ